MTDYEVRLAAFLDLLIQRGYLTRAELQSGTAERGSAHRFPPLTVDQTAAMILHAAPSRRLVALAPRFRIGERVRVRDVDPVGLVRLPVYPRGRVGVITRDHGVFAVPRTGISQDAEAVQHIYSARFIAEDPSSYHLASADGIYVDVWEDFLEAADR